MTDKLERLSDKIVQKSNSEPNKENLESELTKIIKDLTKIKEKGNDLYKRNKKEEALQKFLKGYNQFHESSKKFNNEYSNSRQYEELLIIYKKILSNLALCYYKQGNYKEAIVYDLEMIALDPKYGRSIVRLLKSYSKINKTQQAVFYGDVFRNLDMDTRNKFKGINEIIEEENIKLKKIQKEENDKANQDLIKFVCPILILIIAVIFFYLFKKR